VVVEMSPQNPREKSKEREKKKKKKKKERRYYLVTLPNLGNFANN